MLILIFFFLESSFVIIYRKFVKYIKGIVLKQFKLMIRFFNYMFGIEIYFYNDIVYNDNMLFVLYYSDENDNWNQSGILNLLKEEVSFIIEVIYFVNILNVIIIYFFNVVLLEFI